jgi:hypothetical protein
MQNAEGKMQNVKCRRRNNRFMMGLLICIVFYCFLYSARSAAAICFLAHQMTQIFYDLHRFWPFSCAELRYAPVLHLRKPEETASFARYFRTKPCRAQHNMMVDVLIN